MSGYEYKGSGTPGGFWGCLTSALIGAPLLAFSLFVSALGDCVPEEPCNHGLIWQLFIPAILIAALAGFGMRLAVNWIANRKKGGS
jgi:ABC-type Fe3+-siderophore transport system permease subunit